LADEPLRAADDDRMSSHVDVAEESPDDRRRRSSKRGTLFVETKTQNVTVAPGDRAVLNCRVRQLGAKTVSG